MGGTPINCSSCSKRNPADARYCINCGEIMRPVYCATCGKANPDELEQCLECGNPIPQISGIRFAPLVTVIQPTGAMVEYSEPLEQASDDEDPEPPRSRTILKSRRK